jgi:hypothetical protein
MKRPDGAKPLSLMCWRSCLSPQAEELQNGCNDNDQANDVNNLVHVLPLCINGCLSVLVWQYLLLLLGGGND